MNFRRAINISIKYGKVMKLDLTISFFYKNYLSISECKWKKISCDLRKNSRIPYLPFIKSGQKVQ